MKKYKTKPRIVEVVKWGGSNVGEVLNLNPRDNLLLIDAKGEQIKLYAEGDCSFLVQVGDYIAKDEYADIWVFDQENFENLFEEIE